MIRTQTLAELAKIVGGRIIGDPNIIINGVSGLREAKEHEISFLANPRYRNYLDSTLASAVIVGNDISESHVPLVQVDNPYYAFLQIVRFFIPQHVQFHPGIHPTAVIGAEVELGENVSIDAHVVIQDKVKIGANSVIRPGVFIGCGSEIGQSAMIHPNVTIYHDIIIEDHVTIHAGTVIGSDGFGYAFQEGMHHKVPQVGNVIIGSNVEIGANTTIDRGTLGSTQIRAGSKIDNLVQIGHNVIIGENSIVVAQVGISGSTTMGNYVVVGGQAGIGGHLQIGNGVQIGAQSGVTKSVPSGTSVSGYPARPHHQAKRKEANILRLPQLYQRIRQLEHKIQELTTLLEKSPGQEQALGS